MRRQHPAHQTNDEASLLLAAGDVAGTDTTTGGLGVLTTDTETPVVTETTVSADLLEALKVVTHLLVDLVRDNVRVLAVVEVTLTVKEPGGDLELGGVLHDGLGWSAVKRKKGVEEAKGDGTRHLR